MNPVKKDLIHPSDLQDSVLLKPTGNLLLTQRGTAQQPYLSSDNMRTGAPPDMEDTGDHTPVSVLTPQDVLPPC